MLGTTGTDFWTLLERGVPQPRGGGVATYHIRLHPGAGLPASRGRADRGFSGVVDIPNSCATVYLPTEIFDFDVRPSAGGPTRIDPGPGAPKATF